MFTQGAYLSGDLDVLAGVNDAFDLVLATYSFRKEDRKGRKLDMAYLTKRLADEGGDISLIGGSAAIDGGKDRGGQTDG